MATLIACLFLAVAGLAWADSPQNSQPQQPQQADSGTIRGTVRYVPDPKKPWRLGRYYIRSAASGELAEAVVAIDAPQQPLAKRPASRLLDMDQKNFQFVPETMAIRAADRIRFLNSDPHTHNVKSAFKGHEFNITMPVGTEHIEAFPIATGISQPYRLDCVFHSDMRAWVFVFDHPWFQVTQKDGEFLLEQVPPGQYTLEVMHPAGNLRSRRPVTVSAGQEVRVDIQLGLQPGKP